jgi:hypothetical protein
VRNLNTETIEKKGYKKTENSRDEIHEVHSTMQFIRPQEKLKYFRT